MCDRIEDPDQIVDELEEDYMQLDTDQEDGSIISDQDLEDILVRLIEKHVKNSCFACKALEVQALCREILVDLLDHI